MKSNRDVRGRVASFFRGKEERPSTDLLRAHEKIVRSFERSTDPAHRRLLSRAAKAVEQALDALNTESRFRESRRGRGPR